MSVSIKKLNTAGLGGNGFGVNKKTTGTSAQAARNLSSSSAASRSSVFSFSQSNRTSWTPGQHINRDTNKYNYQGARTEMNGTARASAYKPIRSSQSTGVYGHSGHANNVNFEYGNKAYMTGNILGQVAGNTLGFLNQVGVIDKIKGSSIGEKIGNIFGGGSDNSTNIGNVSSSGAASAISNMASCNDSASLRSAIASANGQLSSLQAQSGTLKAAGEQAEKNLESLKSAVDTAKDDVKEKTQNLKTAKNSVDICTKDRDNKQVALKNANAEYGEAKQVHQQKTDAHNKAQAHTSECQANVNSAQASYDSAKAAYDSAPKDVPDGNGGTKPNPELPQLKAKMEAANDKLKQAEAQLKTAKEAEAKAKTEMDEAAKAETAAKEKVGEADQQVKDADKALNDSQAKLDKAEKAEKQAQDDLKAAEEKKTKAEADLSKAESAIEKYKENQQDIKELQSAITKQNKRLGELQEKENKKYADLSSQIDKNVEKNNKRKDSINPNDGMSISEKIKAKKMEKTNEKNEKLLNQKEGYTPLTKDNVYITNELLKKDPDFTAGGQQFRMGTTPSGREVYYRGNEPVDKETYEAGKKEAGLKS